ncbi:hypothetical protein ACFE04_016224 [Oxalis oulophora]
MAAGASSEESVVETPSDVISTVGQRCQSGELVEWRSSEQVENGLASTSPLFWDTDDDEDGGTLCFNEVYFLGLRPSELYGKYTWKIEKFSQINKRELRSNAFEVGGYKWYILIYPQGCDVCNHLSLFLCVANHDKLLPGWSHFAQFTIAVVNKDPKKSKYSDTLHRFWKKEHDWGWKKFMEISKVFDGFVDSDTLIIKAQVQVIREKPERPFRCLDCQYRRELVRVYLTNVEQICRRFVEERRGKLGRLIEDKARWSSFCAFWAGIDQSARRRMSREKTDAILKVVVKHFFIEKDVTSTLVMDSLYSGLKVLEGQNIKCKKGRAQLVDFEDMHPAPIVRVEKDVFVLVDDVLLLLERAALEPLPPKDEKGPQNRTKDGNSGDDFYKDSIVRDETRLTELGRRTVEIFVLAHIFSNKIEVAYQEAVALKRQEELIREEEASWLAENELKAKRGAEKEKKSKKKQAKQKRNNRKGKDKCKDEKAMEVLYNQQEENSNVEKIEVIADEPLPPAIKPDVLEDVSDISDSVDGVTEAVPPDSEDRDVTVPNSDTDVSEIHPVTETSSNGISGMSMVRNGIAERKGPHLIEDSSSTCSADSMPSVVIMNVPGNKGNSSPSQKNKKSRKRVKNQRSKMTSDATSWSNDTEIHPLDRNDISGSSKGGESEVEPNVTLLQGQIKSPDQKEEISQQKKPNIKVAVDVERPANEIKLAVDVERPVKEIKVAVEVERPVKEIKVAVEVERPVKEIKVAVDVERPVKEKTPAVPSSSPQSPSLSPPTNTQRKSNHMNAATSNPNPVQKTPSNGMQDNNQAKFDTQKAQSPKPPEKLPVMSRPLSSPLLPGPRPSAPAVSIAQTTPLLARSVSAAGRLGPDPTPALPSFVPQSYRNAIIGNNPIGQSPAGFARQSSSVSGISPSQVYSQPAAIASTPMSHTAVQSSFSFDSATRGIFQNGPQWVESSLRAPSSTVSNEVQNLDCYNRPLHSTSGRPSQGGLTDEFPHLDIINDLLDDEQSFISGSLLNDMLDDESGIINGPRSLTRQFSYPGDLSFLDDHMGSSSNGSCRFERTRSYHNDGFQRGFNNLDSVRDYIPQASRPLPYMSGQQIVDSMIQSRNRYQMSRNGFAMSGMRNTEEDSYPYYNPNYANLASDINGYAVFRPSNGH